MVAVINSEYRNNFVPKFGDNFNAYSSNVGYRSSRRNAECRHNKDVFTWEPEQWEKNSCSSMLQVGLREGVTPSAQQKHAAAVQAQQERELIDSVKKQCQLHVQQPEKLSQVVLGN